LAAGITATAGGQALLHAPEAIARLAPVPRPPGIACFVTWKAHIEEAAAKGFALRWPEPGSEIRPYKANPDAVAGPGTPLRPPSYAAALDVECEMAAIVGVGGKDLTVEQARRAIAGCCVFNDVSVRDIQKREMEFGLGPAEGKDQDAGNILGPWLVTADEVGDPRGLRMSLHVNGTEWSSCDTARMEWDFAELVAYLARGQSILPGQVVTSGSYPGRRLRPGSGPHTGAWGHGRTPHRPTGQPDQPDFAERTGISARSARAGCLVRVGRTRRFGSTALRTADRRRDQNRQAACPRGPHVPQHVWYGRHGHERAGMGHRRSRSRSAHEGWLVEAWAGVEPSRPGTVAARGLPRRPSRRPLVPGSRPCGSSTSR
jgi:2-keto-4-pentenoate hydratase/2-oxohepta-3-ene-1,7-dioic acid hydratase in catechol pathway